MRTTLLKVLAVTAVLAAAEVQAQSYGNRTIGLGVGYTSIQSDVEPIKWAVPITLEGGYYVESGFDVYLRIPLMMAYTSVGLGPSGTSGGLVIGTGGQFGIRYLFLEESLRPYAGVHLSGVYFFRDSALGPNFQFGPGLAAGLDYFVGESISVGARAFFDFFIVLNAPVRFALGGGLAVTTYF